MTDERYMRPGVDHAIGKTIEECGELTAALGKTLRWGLYSYNPELPEDQREYNIDWVIREMEDVKYAVVNLAEELEKIILAADPKLRNKVSEEKLEKL